MNAMLKNVFGKADRGGLSQSISVPDALTPDCAGLAIAQSRAIETLSGELTLTSHDIETHIHELADKFQNMAAAARAQTETVQGLMSSVQKIELDGESIPLADLSASLSQTLTELVEKINQLTTRSVAMSHALGDVQAEIRSMHASITQIEKSTSRRSCSLSTRKSKRHAQAPQAAALPWWRPRSAIWQARSTRSRTR